MRFSYPFTLARRAVVVTMDLSAANLELFATDHWLSDPKNIVLVRLMEPAWVTGEAAAPTAPANTRDLLSKCTVVEFGNVLRGKDLAGPAAILGANGVNGADMVTMTETLLEQELRLTPFAARKVIQARDAFLSGSS